MRDVTDATFQQTVLEASGPVLVDFWAEWCPPCVALTPILESVEKEAAGKVTIVKMNADENPDTAVTYGVRGLPTVLLFQGGELKERLVGLRPKKAYLDAIAKGA